MQAIGEMQKNPKETMAKYQHDAKFMEILKEFMQMMG